MSTCPKCKTGTLEHALSPSLGLGFPKQPLQCKSCRGVWLPADLPENREFREVFEEEEHPEASRPDVDRTTGLCPNGHGILTRARLELEESFFLDKCHQCGGIFFDQGEWSRLATHHLLDSIPLFWTQAWQRRQQRTTSRGRYLERLRKRLGGDLMTNLLELGARLRGHRFREEALALIREESSKRDPEDDPEDLET